MLSDLFYAFKPGDGCDPFRDDSRIRIQFLRTFHSGCGCGSFLKKSHIIPP